MEPSLILPPERDERWDLAKQVGVETAVVHTLEIGDGSRPWKYDELLALTREFRDYGLDVGVIEGCVPISDDTRLGRDGRDEEIERFKQYLRHLGSLDVPVVAYDWMAGKRWARTSTALPARGGSLTTAYSNEFMEDAPEQELAPVHADELWDALEHFLNEVVPVAEEAGVKLALHPDDPPIENLRGVDRIVTSPEHYERVMEMYDSEHNGITFCQGNFAAMGADIPETIRRFGDRINFVHFRDVEGTNERFVETWHDEGPTDMRACIQAYRDIGFDGPVRPDHVPTMAGEENSNPGYMTLGRLYATGYLKGLLEAVE
ncbi:mannonate dehydratase [Haloferax sulfurifontis]|uniref:mannonate dehydratase n=2 Tax=Haloferax sulfurifontis TaxID=255616 RepID=M0IKK5_9EURY|nr:mannonate dehydratase [Haloferax sulfurifontis]ELZ96388.1 Mannonate dehydratase [Haloferax sulfurifontis ATCC BAA-897]GGC64413.1 mannonate dehydratase [Haloferax sulfurifontis]